MAVFVVVFIIQKTLGSTKLAETVKEFEALYKKCKSPPKGAVKAVTGHAKTLKYFRYDMENAFVALEEVIAEEKCSEDPIKASKIEDYCKNREVAGLLKAVQWNLNSMVDAYKELDKLENHPGFGKPNVKNLMQIQDQIIEARKLKKQRKEGKLDPKILKLEKQVNIDLEEIMNFWDGLEEVEKITSGRRNDPKSDYNKRVKEILKAKPKLSSRTKKYLELAPKMLHRKALQRTVSQCQKAAKSVNEAANKAISAAKKNNSKGLVESITTGDKELLALDKIEETYAKILDKYSKEIDKSDGKKAIEKAFKNIEKIKGQANKRWESAKAEVTQLTENQDMG
jgi:hypothetical protein